MRLYEECMCTCNTTKVKKTTCMLPLISVILFCFFYKGRCGVLPILSRGSSALKPETCFYKSISDFELCLYNQFHHHLIIKSSLTVQMSEILLTGKKITDKSKNNKHSIRFSNKSVQTKHEPSHVTVIYFCIQLNSEKLHLPVVMFVAPYIKTVSKKLTLLTFANMYHSKYHQSNDDF